MTPEDILASLVAHSQQLTFGPPDPIIIEARDEKIGKKKPQNWRLLNRSQDKLDDLRLELYPSTPSALGRQTRSGSRHSLAEVSADALVGMYDRNWQALQVAIGIGETVRPELNKRLTRVAYRLKNEERVWPDKLRRRPGEDGRAAAEDYVPDLVTLAIRHLEHPLVFRNNAARAVWFGLAESHWHAVARRPFEQVAAHVWSWYYSGIGHIQHRIMQRAQAVD